MQNWCSIQRESMTVICIAPQKPEIYYLSPDLRPFLAFSFKFNSDIVPFFFETKVVVMKAVDGICYLGILKYKFSLVKPEEKIIPKNLLLNRIDSHPKYQPQPYTTHLLIHSLHQTFDWKFLFSKIVKCLTLLFSWLKTFHFLVWWQP